MSRWGRRHRRWAVVVSMLAVIAAVPAVGVLISTAGATTGGSAPEAGVIHAVGAAAQQAARTFWTPARMAAATPAAPAVKTVTAGPAIGPPPGTPTAKPFNGVPPVGALFYTNGSAAHFCTASVIRSTAGDLVFTAAHCVVDKGTYATNVEFVPGYHQVGVQPYGAWAVKTILAAKGWVYGQNPNLDFAFLAVTPPTGTTQTIQQVTGALTLGINRPYRRPIEVIGYNDSDTEPVECATHSFEFEPAQLEFYCHDYRDGTSGGPWIVRYNSSNGTGVVIGTIGGYEQGGDYEWASYSAYLGQTAYLLYRLAEG